MFVLVRQTYFLTNHHNPPSIRKGCIFNQVRTSACVSVCESVRENQFHIIFPVCVSKLMLRLFSVKVKNHFFQTLVDFKTEKTFFLF